MLPSLPVSISNHPFFQQDLDEVKAKEFLKTEHKTNLLFCPAKVSNELLLCYRASFKGNNEVRVFKFTYNANLRRIVHTSLGEFSGLYPLLAKLTAFLKGFADEDFLPVPTFRKSLLTERFSLQVNPQFSKVPNDLFSSVIVSYLNISTIFKVMQVSKSCYLLCRSSIPAILKRIDQMEKLKDAKRVELTKYIFGFINKEMQPDREGEGSSFKCLWHNGFKISEPQWYGESILCRVDSDTIKKGYLILRPTFMKWMNGEAPVSDEFHQQLFNACKHGLNSIKPRH